MLTHLAHPTSYSELHFEFEPARLKTGHLFDENRIFFTISSRFSFAAVIFGYLFITSLAYSTILYFALILATVSFSFTKNSSICLITSGCEILDSERSVVVWGSVSS